MPVDPQVPSPKRTRIWELASTLHCSIVGTCLTASEMRHVIAKLNIPGIGTADDHEIHMMGVTLAGRHDTGAKLLQKALDRRHDRSIRQFAKAKDEQAVVLLWEQAVQSGDIPGTYWATLTHPASTNDVIKKAFGDVHMLSHLVGAANRADILRLRQLEQDNAALTLKVERQQSLLRDGFAERDDTIRRLKDAMGRKVAEETAKAHEADGHVPDQDYQIVIDDLQQQLGAESTQRKRLEQRMEALTRSLALKDRDLRAQAQQYAALRQELELVERQWAPASPSASPEDGSAPDLAGLTILYVGGRPHQIPQLNRLMEERGAQLLHHDGGIDHNSALLPGLISRSDFVLFPVDCVSHDAVIAIKRMCRNMQKSYHPLRNSGIASCMATLSTLCRQEVQAAAE